MPQPSTPPPGQQTPRWRPSRRGFLIGAGATTGLVVAYALWPRRWPGGMVAGEDETGFGPWLRIDTDGQVTVAVPQAEMGQGVYSGFAQIIADELGADWQMMAVVPAPFHPAYAQTAVAATLAASLPPVVRTVAAHLGEDAIRRLNLHLTCCSTSITAYHDILRHAAAEARARLVAAAATEWEVSADALDTGGGFIVYKANRMAFGDAVRRIDPAFEPAAAPLRATASRRLAGKALPRLDVPAKTDGSARFGADVRLPGMVYAAIRHGPVGGRLLTASAPAGIVLVKGPNWVATTGPTNWEARRALARIEAGFAIAGRAAGPWIETALQQAATGSSGEVVQESGDVDAALGQSPLVADYALPFLAHASPEPMTATARLTAGTAELWGPTQSVTLVHQRVAEALGLERQAIRTYPTLVGGSFGRTLEPDAFVEAALIARAIGKPVQLLWNRADDLTTGSFRPAVHARLRGSLDGKGGIAALEAQIATPGVFNSLASRYVPLLARETEAPTATAIDGIASTPYALAARRSIHLPLAQPVPLGLWRASSHSFSAFLIESFIDELATAAKADPLAFRLGLLAGKPRHQKLLRAVATAADWADPPRQGMAKGIALHESFGSIAAMVVEAGVSDGRIRLGTVATALDCGHAIAPDSVRAQLEGAAIMGLSAAIGEAQTFADGAAANRDFNRYTLLKLDGAPARIVTVLVNSGDALGGAGDPGLPAAAPALANALFRATGKRARQLPLAATFKA